MSAEPPTDGFVRALPKVELHVHVEGAVEPSTIADLARRNGVDLGVSDPSQLYRYDGLADFLRVFDLVCRCVRTSADLHRVTYEALGIAASAGVRYREMMFSPTFLMRHGVDFPTIWTGIAAGIADARTDHGIVGRMILDVHKPGGRGPAEELLDLALGCDRELLVGLGGDAGEDDIDLPAFAPVFARARRHGLRTTMHLSEAGPADDVRIGVEVLGLDRIDHGVHLVDDAALVATVAARGIPVTCCPTSNVAIGVVPSIAEHPIEALHDAGVLVTVNSDNAEMFRVDVADELIALRDAFGWDRDRLVQCCLDGLESAWLDEADRSSYRASFEREIAALS